MAGPHTPRARARARLLTEIKQQALTQLADDGAGQLSLRAVARELGMVSSGLYRYFGSRDELLTALIVDAYTDLAETLEHADAGLTRSSHRRRWIRRGLGLRQWAAEQPHRFQLLYGSPVPGYAAPRDTVEPAAAVIVALLRPLDDAYAAGAVTSDTAPRSRLLRRQLQAVTALLELRLDAATLTHGVGAFAQLIGLITLELGGHLVGGFEPADDLYAHALREQADRIGFAS